MATNTVVHIKNMVKKYGDFTAVDSLSLEIHQGECFGVLGPNGAGKSSLMRIMYGSSQLTSGEVFILGMNVKQDMSEIKARIGVVPQEDSLDTDLSVSQNLFIFGRFFDLDEKTISERTDALLRLMKLEDRTDASVDSLSGGLKRRLAIARGLMNQPEILFLDEPTTGLDPQARRWVWEFFKNLKRQKATLILTTHYMEEAEHLCDRVAIVDHGRILSIGTPAELMKEHIGNEVIEFDCEPGAVNYFIEKIKSRNLDYQVWDQTVHVFLKGQQSAADLVPLFSSDRVVLRRPNLNDVFLRLSGTKLRNNR
jgi:lipooligosaccharide transport system ATP-binding protein